MAPDISTSYLQRREDVACAEGFDMTVDRLQATYTMQRKMRGGRSANSFAAVVRIEIERKRTTSKKLREEQLGENTSCLLIRKHGPQGSVVNTNTHTTHARHPTFSEMEIVGHTQRGIFR